MLVLVAPVCTVHVTRREASINVNVTADTWEPTVTKVNHHGNNSEKWLLLKHSVLILKKSRIIFCFFMKDNGQNLIIADIYFLLTRFRCFTLGEKFHPGHTSCYLTLVV